MASNPITKCRRPGCGMPICWGETDDGKPIPLDAQAACYVVIGFAGGNRRIRRQENAMVNHFATCKDPPQRKPPPTPEKVGPVAEAVCASCGEKGPLEYIRTSHLCPPTRLGP